VVMMMMMMMSPPSYTCYQRYQVLNATKLYNLAKYTKWETESMLRTNGYVISGGR